MRKDIIINNRLVSDKTFAIRLKSFMDTVTFSDACAADEVEYFRSVANSLLSYQLFTAEDEEEVAYLTRLGHLPIVPTLKTHDGVLLYLSYDLITVYSCMESPNQMDVPKVIIIKTLKDVEKINKKRLLFWDIEKCNEYIKDNSKVYSKTDLLKLGIKI